MQKVKSILLLFLMGIILFPWQTICLAHPLGEPHHEGKSTCELRREYKGDQAVFWPPMHCKHEVLKSTDFQQPHLDQLLFAVSPFLITTYNFEFISDSKEIKPYLFLEEPNCRSATIISDNPHRGPPLV